MIGHSRGWYWPETGLLPDETRNEARLGVFKLWIAGVLTAACFWGLAVSLMQVKRAQPWAIYVTLLVLISLVFGLSSLSEYRRRTRHLRAKD